ncbi:uncharacterized protein LOC111873534 isoform X2 [Cryptotermes secundus]|uniref:uncharacterized protein LOC111873534 isoform X2 n=1 Tax=Cryptotermes secundus TaxID=105785 RepID=UPI000CD7D8AC|nr:uncharacterized protein LOC111873534 isoform X2 [Cryptotermes secundus]
MKTALLLLVTLRAALMAPRKLPHVPDVVFPPVPDDDTSEYVTIYNAILTLNFLTCIKFVPWDGKADDFLLIWPVKYPHGCWSYVGRFGGPQIVSLQPPDEQGPNCLGDEGRSIHELLHALGIFHEQSRADRDNFVDIHPENIIPEFQVNFNKESLENTTYSFEYDYGSIMHYGQYYFREANGKMLAVIISVMLASVGSARYVPYVPEVLHPPVPQEARLNADDVRRLDEMGQDPEVTPGLFQGDLALTDEMYDYWRIGIRWDVMPQRMWPNGTVPYVISPLYDTPDYVTIYKAIITLNSMTCIRFVPWNGKDKDYLLIWPVKQPKGCWSYVGRFGGPQIVSLQPPDKNGPNCLGGEGRSIHELLHALGIFHEQSRADRDMYVDVKFENIIPEYRNNFNKQSLENTTYNFEYDYDSIMHYGQYFFSKTRGQPTIIPKKENVKLGQRKAISKTDCLKINDLYGCLSKSVYHNRKYYTLCDILGY